MKVASNHIEDGFSPSYAPPQLSWISHRLLNSRLCSTPTQNIFLALSVLSLDPNRIQNSCSVFSQLSSLPSFCLALLWRMSNYLIRFFVLPLDRKKYERTPLTKMRARITSHKLACVMRAYVLCRSLKHPISSRGDRIKKEIIVCKRSFYENSVKLFWFSFLIRVAMKN